MKYFILIWITLILLSGSVYGQGASVSPPPMGYPNYDFSEEIKAGEDAIILNETEDMLAPEWESKVELQGEGWNKADETSVGNSVFHKSSRIDVMMAEITTDTTTISLTGISLVEDQYESSGYGSRVHGSLLFGNGGGMDFLLYDANFLKTYGEKKGNITPVYFGGLNIGIGSISADMMATSMYSAGLTAGAQVLIDVGGFTISPSFTYVTKSSSTSTTNGGVTSSSSFTSSAMTYGIDFLHVSSGYTLSGILQAAKEDDSSSDTTILQFGKTW